MQQQEWYWTMKPEKSILEQILNWLINLPGWLKNGVALIGLVVGFIVSFRSDMYLYSVVIVSLTIFYVIGLSSYIILKREPSPFGGKGAYKYYLFRPFAKFVLGGILLLTVVLLSFAQSREYVRYAVWGTPTIVPSPTPDFTDKLLEISSSWDRQCGDNVVILNDNDLPLIERAYYNFSKGNKEEYYTFRDRATTLDWYFATHGQSWEYSGLSLGLNSPPNITGTIILQNEIKVTANYLPVNDMVNIFTPFLPGCGGGGSASYFSPIHLFPGMNALSKNNKFDYFSIVPGEALYFTFYFVCDAPGVYNLIFGILYLYRGTNGEYEYLDNHSILCPKAFSVYEYWVDGHFQRYPGSPNYVESLPDDEEFGKLTKTGEYHVTGNGEYVENLDWLPKDKIPPLPFWRMTVFDNSFFLGTPTFIDDIKIESNRLDTYVIEFFTADYTDKINTSNNAYSIVLETEQHFFGGRYSVCVFDINPYPVMRDVQSGFVQVDIDGNSVTPFFKMDAECSEPSFEVTNGNHIVSVKFLRDETMGDAYFSIYFQYEK